MNSSHSPFYIQTKFALVSIAEVTNDPHISVAFNHNPLCLAHISFQLIWCSPIHLFNLEPRMEKPSSGHAILWKKQENKNLPQTGS